MEWFAQKLNEKKELKERRAPVGSNVSVITLEHLDCISFKNYKKYKFLYYG
jgi:hypothetical protein